MKITKEILLLLGFTEINGRFSRHIKTNSEIEVELNWHPTTGFSLSEGSPLPLDLSKVVTLKHLSLLYFFLTDDNVLHLLDPSALDLVYPLQLKSQPINHLTK